MPPPTLNDREIAALIPYLKGFAHFPAPEQPRSFGEPALRVGQLIVSGTCHVCHDATGPGNRRLTMMQDVIPSLTSLTTAYDLREVASKVRQGNAGRGMRGDKIVTSWEATGGLRSMG
jgi:mono/diheme cytochrome c family protein